MLKIKNNSQWPDWFVRPVCKWIVGRAGIACDYTIVLPAVTSKTMIAGRAYPSRWIQRIRIARRFQPAGGFPYTTTYWKYKWAFKYQLHNRLEAFVDIVAHEACHQTDGDPSRFESPSGVGPYAIRPTRIDRAGMEMVCERFSRDTVEEFRRIWKTDLRPRVVAARRKASDSIRESKRRGRAQRNRKPSTKLALEAYPCVAQVIRDPGRIEVVLKPGWSHDGCHFIYEDTTAEMRKTLSCVEPCDCEDCRDQLAATAMSSSVG